MADVGIDFGTIRSSIATCNEEGVPMLVADCLDEQAFDTPSLVRIDANGCSLGAAVEDWIADHPNGTVAHSIKPGVADPGFVLLDHLGRRWTARSLAALLIAKLRRDAASRTGEDIGRAVIAVPAAFNQLQRQAVRQAALLASFPTVRIVDEPMAAAVFLGAGETKPVRALVYDSGGCAFTATALRCTPEGITLLASEIDARAGGEAVDDVIAEALSEEWQRRFGDPADSQAAVQFRQMAKRLKHLAGQSTVDPIIISDVVAGQPFEYPLTRAHFDRLIGPVLDRTVATSERAINAGGLEWSDLDVVYLTGGGSRIPAVIAHLAARVPTNAIRQRHPVHAVTFGAAMIASEKRAGGRHRAFELVREAAAYDLGVRIRDAASGRTAICRLVSRVSGSPKAKQIFRTSRDNQSRLIIEVVQCRDDQAISLGHFALGPLPPRPSGHAIEVAMAYNDQGFAEVTAVDVLSRQRVRYTVDAARHDHSVEDDRALIESLGPLN